MWLPSMLCLSRCCSPTLRNLHALQASTLTFTPLDQCSMPSLADWFPKMATGSCNALAWGSNLKRAFSNCSMLCLIVLLVSESCCARCYKLDNSKPPRASRCKLPAEAHLYAASSVVLARPQRRAALFCPKRDWAFAAALCELVD